MLEKMIDKHLKKQGFIRVPASWTDDYKELVHKKTLGDRIIREIGREYNQLLKEFAEDKSQKWLKEELEELKIDINGLDKEGLINKYVEAFSVTFEDDFNEEVK